MLIGDRLLTHVIRGRTPEARSARRAVAHLLAEWHGGGTIANDDDQAPEWAWIALRTLAEQIRGEDAEREA